MATVDAPRMTVEEFLALPDDGVERMLIDGVVRELGTTVRGWRHAAVQANISHLLQARGPGSATAAWPRRRRRGRVPPLDGDPRRGRYRLCLAELVAATPKGQAYFIGSPTLAVEVLSPSDTQGDVDDKVAAYLEADVPMVWVVQTRFQTVTVYRPDAQPSLYNVGDEIDAEPHLPGFRAAVAMIFED